MKKNSVSLPRSTTKIVSLRGAGVDTAVLGRKRATITHKNERRAEKVGKWRFSEAYL